MIPLFKYRFALAGLLLAAGSCSTSEPPVSDNQTITWEVAGVDSPGTQSRALVGPETDPEGNPFPNQDWITLEQACAPLTDGGNGKAIGIWADYNYTDNQGNDVVVTGLFQGTRLIYAKKQNGNPHSDWNYEGDDQYWYHGGSYKFRAFFPQEIIENVITSANASTFVLEYPTHDMQEDLLLAYNHVDTSDPTVDLGEPVSLHFAHGLAAIRFFVKANYTNTDYLTSCYLQNAPTRDFSTSGILAYGSADDAESISWRLGYYPPETERIYAWSNSGVEFSTDQYGKATPAMAYTQAGTTEGDLFTQNNGWVLILPQTSPGNLQFCFTTQNGEGAVYTVTLPEITEQSQGSDGSVVQSREYLPGKRYTYTITISETKLDLTLTVADWNERESSHSIVF